jgi:hypothetical protein
LKTDVATALTQYFARFNDVRRDDEQAASLPLNDHLEENSEFLGNYNY